MPRPLSTSTENTTRDVALLGRVLQRVELEEGRDPKEKKQIADGLRAALAGLVKWTVPVATRANGHKEKPRSESKVRERLRAER